MGEWLTYSLADFLLFSAATYERLFALANEAQWPAQIAALAAGLAILALLLRPGGGRLAAVLLAAAWLWVAWSFHHLHYATINWAAEWFAVAFALQALLLLVSGLGGRLARAPRPDWRSRAGLALAAFAVLLQPLLAPLLGRPWAGLELFGVAPDPTAVATLGLLLAAARPPWELLLLPLAWCLVSGLTLLALDSPLAALPFGAVLLTLSMLLRRPSLRPAAGS